MNDTKRKRKDKTNTIQNEFMNGIENFLRRGNFTYEEINYVESEQSAYYVFTNGLTARIEFDVDHLNETNNRLTLIMYSDKKTNKSYTSLAEQTTKQIIDKENFSEKMNELYKTLEIARFKSLLKEKTYVSINTLYRILTRRYIDVSFESLVKELKIVFDVETNEKVELTLTKMNILSIESGIVFMEDRMNKEEFEMKIEKVKI